MRALVLAALAFGGVARAESFADGHVQLGTCELGADPETDEGAEAIGVSACARGEAGAEITAVTGAPRENFWMRYAQGALGLYYGQYLSLQGRAHLRDRLLLARGGKTAAAPKDLERETDYALVQVGNPALHRFFLQAGRMSLPFGLDTTWAAESYRTFENRSFWASPRYGASLGIDNKVNTRLDIGYAEAQRTGGARESLDLPSAADLRTVRRQAAASLRLSYDISALDGSRIVVSGYGENHGVRRMGLGLVNVSRRADTTEFEFVRRLAEPTGGGEAFQQIIRLAYAGAVRGSGRWVVQFDDERYRFRMGTVGQDFRVKEHGLLRLGLAYQKSENGDGKRRWMFTTGLGGQL